MKVGSEEKGSEDEKVKGRLSNLAMILAHDQTYLDRFAYDLFHRKIVFRSHKDPSQVFDYDDETQHRLRVRLATDYGDFKPYDVESAITTVAMRNQFHPLQDRIKSLLWDGRKRVETWLTRICGADDNEYTRAVAKMWCISAIARAFKPGIKVDTMMVLEGAQGTNKSALIEEMSYGHFLDNKIDIQSKDGKQSLFGKWFVEFAELEGLNKKSSEAIKQFLTNRTDVFRLPYERTEKQFPRTSIFVGTTNEAEYLEDPTGNRRFWPVKIERVNLKKVEEERDQIWAEAYQLFLDGHKWWVHETDDIAKYFRIEQEQRVVRAEIHDDLRCWVEDNILVSDDGCYRVSVKDVWTRYHGGRVSDLDRRKEKEVVLVLKGMGFEKKKPPASYDQKRTPVWTVRFK